MPSGLAQVVLRLPATLSLFILWSLQVSRCWRVGYRCRRLRFTVGDLGRGDLTCYQSVHWHFAPVVDPYSLYGSTTGAGYAIVTDIGLRLNLQ